MIWGNISRYVNGENVLGGMAYKSKYIYTIVMFPPERRTLIDELLALPITCHTLKHRQRKRMIESELSELDDAIKIFSRPKVFVKVQ